MSTGATATTWGSLAIMSATLIDAGAPVIPTIADDPGGATTTSAPMPACRWRESLSMPMERPTISKMRVTSKAMAMMLIRDRMGRCARLATIILFIMMVFRYWGWFGL